MKTKILAIMFFLI